MAMPAPAPLYPDTSRRDWTADELALLPDDGQRYEVVDGELLVTPAPTDRHQFAIGELYERVKPYASACGFDCLFAPSDVRFSARREVQPDLLVRPRRPDGSRAERFSEVGRLLLAVEVLSPSTARADRHVKRRMYQQEGVPDYWIVDTGERFFERWRPGDELPEILTELLSWQPRDDAAPLVIDLPAYFRAVVEG